MFDLTQRVLLAFFSGYFLCLSGSLSQLTTSNPISSPSTLGFTGLGVLSILTGFFLKTYAGFEYSLELMSLISFVFLLFCLYLIISINKKKFKNMKSIILLGISFNLFIGAIFSIVNFIFISKGIQFPSSIWFGNFRFYDLNTVVIFFVLFIACIIFIKRAAAKLEIMNFGDQFAKNLNVNTQKMTYLSLGLSLVLTCVVVINFGVFSFVGLVMPHILRAIPVFKYSIRKELNYGPFVAGAIIVILDQICYHTVINGAEFPVGMLSAVFGSISLIIILFRSDKVSL